MEEVVRGETRVPVAVVIPEHAHIRSVVRIHPSCHQRSANTLQVCIHRFSIDARMRESKCVPRRDRLCLSNAARVRGCCISSLAVRSVQFQLRHTMHHTVQTRSTACTARLAASDHWVLINQNLCTRAMSIPHPSQSSLQTQHAISKRGRTHEACTMFPRP